MTDRIFNFGAGPAVLPEPVLEEVRENLMALPGVGMSVFEISHRSKAFDEILTMAETNIRTLAVSLLGTTSCSSRVVPPSNSRWCR